MDGPTQTLPRLYELNSSDFHDITTGSNGFNAGAGYDLVTGRGTPKANLPLPDLAGGRNHLHGNIFNDENGNGTQDSGEPPLSGWTVFVDFNGTGTFASNDASTTTDSNGNFTLSDVPGGTYKIDEETQSGWRQTVPASGGHSVTVTYQQAVTGQNFADQQNASISGLMFNDLNGDGVREISEPILSGWTIYIDTNNDGTFDTGDVQVTSGSNGVYSFPNLVAGDTYTIRQTTPAGWRRTLPQTLPITITVKAGEAITGLNFASTTTVSPGNVSSGSLPSTSAVVPATAGTLIGSPPPKPQALAVNTAVPLAANDVQIGFADEQRQPSNLAGLVDRFIARIRGSRRRRRNSIVEVPIIRTAVTGWLRNLFNDIDCFCGPAEGSDYRRGWVSLYSTRIGRYAVFASPALEQDRHTPHRPSEPWASGTEVPKLSA